MKPKDFIAGLVVVTYAILKIAQIDAEIDPALFLVLGYYFVKRGNGSDNGK